MPKPDHITDALAKEAPSQDTSNPTDGHEPATLRYDSDDLEPSLREAMTPPHTMMPDDSKSPAMVEAMRHVYDPEIPVNIYELGLVYEIILDKKDAESDGDHAHIIMTLTSPNCPVAGELPGWVQDAVAEVDGIASATVELTWDPPWNPSLMAETARYQLNMFD